MDDGREAMLNHQEQKTESILDVTQILPAGPVSMRLFFNPQQATCTFLHDDQVVSLHYDLSRRAVFLNGHRVTDAAQYENLPLFLSNFKKALLEHSVGADFIRAYDLQVSEIFTHPVINQERETQL